MTYNPHLLECGACFVPFTDGQRVYPWFEDMICSQCAPEFIRDARTAHVFRTKKTTVNVDQPK